MSTAYFRGTVRTTPSCGGHRRNVLCFSSKASTSLKACAACSTATDSSCGLTRPSNTSFKPARTCEVQPRARGFHKTSSKRTSDCTTSDLPTRSRLGGMENWSVDSMGYPSAACFLGKACSQQKATLQSFALFSWLNGRKPTATGRLIAKSAIPICCPWAPKSFRGKRIPSSFEPTWQRAKPAGESGQFTSNPQKFRSR